MPNQLLIGSGTWHWEGWTTVDADERQNPDFVAKAPPLPPLVLIQKWDHILGAHVIEHLFLDEAKALLVECYEILLPGGVLTLEQPDIGYCAKVMLGLIEPPEGRSQEQFGIQGLYGAQNGNPWDGHHWGYTPESLTELVVQAGFQAENISISAGRYHEPVRDFTLKAVK